MKTRTKTFWYRVVMFALSACFILAGLGVAFLNAEQASAAIQPPILGETGLTLNQQREAARLAGSLISEEAMEEGVVLLRNENNALPLPQAAPRVTVFGKNSVHWVTGVGGSSGGGGSRHNSPAFHNALRAEGFEVNQVMQEFYMNNNPSTHASPGSYAGRPDIPIYGTSGGGIDSSWLGLATGETPWRAYTPAIQASFANYSDAAIVVFSRQGGEGWDLPRISTNRLYRSDDFQVNTGGSGRWFSFHGGRYNLTAGGTAAQRGGAAVGIHPGSGRALAPHEMVDRRNDHYLQLDVHEEELLRQIQMSGTFDRVIVLLNAANMLELGFLDEAQFGVDAALWIGLPGTNSRTAAGALDQQNRLAPIARILNGDVNPSGRLVSTASRDHTANPVWRNFGQVIRESRTGTNADRMTNHYLTAGLATVPSPGGSGYRGSTQHVEYHEGIYFDYFYYETRAFEEMFLGNYDWHRENVVFPFGHGLSYTSFNWEIIRNTTAITATSMVEIDVRVTNTGTRAGKDVVQLFYNAPYEFGGIEKAHVVLGAFEKTSLLAPNQSEVVRLSMPARDMASWDQFGLVGSRPGLYVLSQGEYNLFVSRNANSWADANAALTVTKNLANPIEITHSATGYEYRNLFEEETQFMHGQHQHFTLPGGALVGNVFETPRIPGRPNPNNVMMSRSNFAATFPVFPSVQNRAITADGATWMQNAFRPGGAGAPNFANGGGETSLAHMNAMDNPSQPWYRTAAQMAESVMEYGGTGSTIQVEQGAGPQRADGTYYTLHDLGGLPFDHPRWSAFLNQWTIGDMLGFTGGGGFSTGMAHRNNTVRGRPADTSRFAIFNSIAPDGPFGFDGHTGNNTNGGIGSLNIGTNTASFVSPMIVAQTFNQELAEEIGEIMGEEGYLLGFGGIYAPGLNAHRSAFGGRNGEYWSADFHLTGKMVAAFVRGIQSRGVLAYMKHFFMNDQETHRASGFNGAAHGLMVWADEQTIRLYGEAWRIVVQEANVLAAMSSFARVGRVWAGANYAAQNTLLRYEWGFRGVMVTDWWNDRMNRDFGIRTGGCLPLNGPAGAGTGGGFRPASGHDTPHQVYWLRRTTHNVAFALANSNNTIHFASSLEQNLTEGVPVEIHLTPRLSIMDVSGGFASQTAGPVSFVHDPTGVAHDSFSITGIDNLPAGLTFDPARNVIHGTPTQVSATPTEVTVEVRNFDARSRNQTAANGFTTERLSTNTFSITVAEAPEPTSPTPTPTPPTETTPEPGPGCQGCGSMAGPSGGLMIAGLGLGLAGLIPSKKNKNNKDKDKK